MTRSGLAVRNLLVRPLVIAAVAFGTVACSSDQPESVDITAEATLVPDETAVAPGFCDPTESVRAPSITTGGETTLATLGLGDFSCGSLNGDGYISFSYNPILIDGEGSIEVSVGEGVTADISWKGDEPFTESTPGVWTSSLRDNTCTRLTIRLKSESTTSSATYGADIRAGGEEVGCPQRSVDPSDPSDGSPDATSPPPPTDITSSD